ncbi:MAG TPA: Rieske (2Fe-2S) protein [Mycobacterium sp.]|nr:Rieske (2Fe-2S) protein [Mycobacterium sp.]HPZ94290.1 Rieske (2Fe-2S) protein [Mycobacterium sp.]HQE14225.1 Rieske (2Fe-2S) protein [Mycobacterium sp.]
MSMLPRRAILIGAAAAPLAACAKAGESTSSTPPTPGQVLTAADAVPVGSGTVVDGTLISQPEPGVFRGFVARCTHAGCALKISDGTVVCPCHGSRFGFDGSVERGPAVDPLVSRPVTVRGADIVAG